MDPIEQELERRSLAANEAVTEIQRVYGTLWEMGEEERIDLVCRIDELIERFRSGMEI